jgi:hypothetical protein
MKKITFLILALCIAFGLNAQHTPLHSVDFESGELGAFWQADETTIAIVDNPDKTAPNTSDKVLKFTKTASGYRQVHHNIPQPHTIRVDEIRGFEFQVYNGGDARLMTDYFVDIRYSGDEPGPQRWIVLAEDIAVTLEQGWNTVHVNVEPITSDRMVQVIRLYPNRNEAEAATFYFDNWKLMGEDEQVAVTGVTLNYPTLDLTVGRTATLVATVAPENATNKDVTWSGNNPAVATVDANGVVTAVNPGNATITVTTADGGFTATSVVTVTEEQQADGIEHLIDDFETGGLGNYWEAPETTIEIVDNPEKAEPNTSDKVLKFTKTASESRQIHHNLPEPHNIRVDELRGFEFQVYNGGDARPMTEYFVDIRYSGDEPGPQRWIILAENEPIALQQGWNTIHVNVEPITSDRMIQVVRIFPNRTEAEAGTFYFDNLKFFLVDPVSSVVDELPAPQLNVFPNPFRNGNLTIDLGSVSNSDGKIMIYSITGALVKSFQIETGTSQVIINPELTPGMYILRIEGNDKTESRRLIVR